VILDQPWELLARGFCRRAAPRLLTYEWIQHLARLPGRAPSGPTVRRRSPVRVLPEAPVHDALEIVHVRLPVVAILLSLRSLVPVPLSLCLPVVPCLLCLLGRLAIPVTLIGILLEPVIVVLPVVAIPLSLFLLSVRLIARLLIPLGLLALALSLVALPLIFLALALSLVALPLIFLALALSLVALSLIFLALPLLRLGLLVRIIRGLIRRRGGYDQAQRAQAKKGSAEAMG